MNTEKKQIPLSPEAADLYRDIKAGKKIDNPLSEIKFTKTDQADMDRIIGTASKAGRMPTDAEMNEIMMLKMIRDNLAAPADSKYRMTIPQLRSQFGGIDREHTIRSAAKAFAHYMAQIDVINSPDGIATTVPEELLETFAALKAKLP
jgi:hypothetical protein